MNIKLVILILIVLLVSGGIGYWIINKDEKIDNFDQVEKVEEKEKKEDENAEFKEDELSIDGQEELAKADEMKVHVVDSPDDFLLDDGANREVNTLGNQCSMDCCSDSWESLRDGVNRKNGYIKSPFYCGNSLQGSGCMCVTPEQALHIQTRGGNGIEVNDELIQ